MVPQQQYNVDYGQTITLTCTVTSNPVHTVVYWQKIQNGQPTNINVVSSNKYSGSTVNTPSLTINNVVLSDEASYVCFATNGVGTGQSSQTTVDVAGGKEIFYMIRIYVIFQHIFYINCGKSNDFLETVM